MKPMQMTMKLSIVGAVVLLVALQVAQVFAEGRGAYKVVANPSISISNISRDELSRIFLKKATKFHDGHGASPMDLPTSSSVRDAFSRDVHGKPTSAVESYWQQQVFSGREVPPAEKPEAGALDFVRSNSNGITYVAPGTDTEGLKVINVTD
jgi:ABC-type phosphate transport system substrate-binding protein